MKEMDESVEADLSDSDTQPEDYVFTLKKEGAHYMKNNAKPNQLSIE